MKRIFLALLGCSICSYAFASSTVTGTVTHVRVDETGHGMVTFSAIISGSPSCINVAYNNTYAFDGTTAGGKNFLALVLASQATGTPITAFGLGTCSIYGAGVLEDVYYGVNG